MTQNKWNENFHIETAITQERNLSVSLDSGIKDGLNRAFDGRKVNVCKMGNRKWLKKYLVLFCETWVVLFLASAMCCTVAQMHHEEEKQYNYLSHQPSSYHHVHHSDVKKILNQGQSRSSRSLTTPFPAARSKKCVSSPGNYGDKMAAEDSWRIRYPYRFRRRRFRSKFNYSSSVDQVHLNITAHKPTVETPIMKRFTINSFLKNSFSKLDDHRTIIDAADISEDQTKEVQPVHASVILSRKLRTLHRAAALNHFIDQEKLSKSTGKLPLLHSGEDHSYQYDNPEPVINIDDDSENGRPCVYNDHLKTDRNWHGYLANISLAGGSGRLAFEFSYRADSCCLNILFYHEDQLANMNPRMTCWQKENLLNFEEDRILRLTPSFIWSGCQVKRKAGSPDMVMCKGGRSFSSHSYDLSSEAANKKSEAHEEKLSKQRERHGNAAVWYVAVSNCGSLRGLNLRYKLKVYGHSIPCGTEYGNDDDSSAEKEMHWSPKIAKTSQEETTNHESNPHKNVPASPPPISPNVASSSYRSNRPSDAAHTHLASESWPVCILNGSVNTTNKWYGFFRNLSLVDGGGFRFHFSLPFAMNPMNVLLYYDNDIKKLHWEQICWLKDNVIENAKVPEQILDLSPRALHNGCVSKTGVNIEGNNLTCKGEKIFSGEKNIYMALSNCRSMDGLLFRYTLEVFGYKDPNLCSGFPETGSSFENLKFFSLCVVLSSVFHILGTAF